MDSSVRWCKRNETQGIPIGPGTSSIIVELILSEIDSKLREKNYLFERYVDDYTCYCESDIEAESFIIDLERYLSEFKLSLNLSKTNIKALPLPNDDEWVLELLRRVDLSRLVFERHGKEL
ncbi:RNA-directed DNA polymerase [Idiomarina aminovorans]|uniref:RNA-directed DNA polymerase n=1 Tax=Idiomarina aminovorans TaxID=2914829 RepID=UPI0032B711F7